MELVGASNRALVVLVLISGAFVALFVHAMSRPHGDRYVMVDNLVRDGLDRHRGEHLKVHGWVVAGSIKRHSDESTEWTWFVIQNNGARLSVLVNGPLPDTVCSQSEVVVTGTLVGDLLSGESVAAKCPTKYDGDPDRPCRSRDIIYE